MANYVYGIEIPLADGYSMYELVRCESPAKVGEVVRILLSCDAKAPFKLQVVSHPLSPPIEPPEGQ